MERPLKITTKTQFERLVQLMEKNPEIIRGKPKFGMTKDYYKELWEEFTIELNTLGPPTRTSQEWQRVWIHYKAKIKQKLANNKRDNPMQEILLNSLEDSVLQLMSLQEQPAASGQIFSIESIDSTSNDSRTEWHEFMTQPTDLPSTTSNRSRIMHADDRLGLLKKQTETQEELLKTIKIIERANLKNYEINKKLLRIKEKKFALYEKQVNQATELHNLKIEYKKLKIEKLRNELKH